MTNEKEATAGLVIAEFEARRAKRTAETRARRLRTILVGARVGLIFAAAAYVQVAPSHLSLDQAIGLLAIFIGLTIWEEHQTREKVRALEAEVERLRDQLEKEGA